MKSKTSCFNKTIFKKNISRFWVIWLGILLWNLFVLPCNIFICYLHQNTWSKFTEAEIEASKISELTGLISVYMNPVILFMFSVGAAMAVFSYLYTFRAANTIHALPVTRKELFVTNYLSGLMFLLLPLFIGFLTGTIVGAACGYTCLDYMFKGMLYAFGLYFFFYTFAVFVALVAGTLAAVPIFTFILNYLYVGCKLLLGLLTNCISYGLCIQFTQGKMDILSPLYYINNKVCFEYDYSKNFPVCKGLVGGNVVIGYAIAAIFFLIGAYFVYKKRDVETAGNLISVPWIASVFRWGTAFCGAILLSVFACELISSGSAKAEFIIAVISAVIFGSVIFFLVQMLLEKGFRVFKKKRFIELGAFLAVMFISLLAVENDWFGAEKKIPAADEIERAYVYCGYPVGSDAKEDISMIQEIHKQCIDNKHMYEDAIAHISEEDKLMSFSVKYFLKNGNTFERSYTVPKNEEEATYQYVKDYVSSTKGYLQNQFGLDYGEYTIEKGGIDLYNAENEYQYYEFTQEQAQEIYEALLADLEAGNMDKWMEHYQCYNEEYEKELYYNSLSFEYEAAENIRFITDEYYYGKDEWMSNRYGEHTKHGSTSVEFTADCENIIQTLTELGVITGKEDLITYEQRQKIEG